MIIFDLALPDQPATNMKSIESFFGHVNINTMYYLKDGYKIFYSCICCGSQRFTKETITSECANRFFCYKCECEWNHMIKITKNIDIPTHISDLIFK